MLATKDSQFWDRFGDFNRNYAVTGKILRNLCAGSYVESCMYARPPRLINIQIGNKPFRAKGESCA